MSSKLQVDLRSKEGPLLEVNDLKTYFKTPRGLVRSVDGVSFSLDRGAALGIVGESGSGKTVLSRSIMEERWVLAGVMAALGTATRPNGLALVLACAVASFLAIRHDREWKSLAAPLLAPLGFIAFQVWLGSHTGEAGVWFRVQSEAWGEGASYGLTAVRKTIEAFSSPFTSPTNVITAASVMAMLLMIYFAWGKRLPLPMVAYSAGILALMLLPNTVTARPRFLYTAFPLFISAAAFLHTDRRDWWPYVIGACLCPPAHISSRASRDRRPVSTSTASC